MFMTLNSAIKTFVLPRAVSDKIARWSFLTVRVIFDVRVHRARTYEEADHIMALYAPIGLGALTISWLVLVIGGYTLIYWGVGVGSLATSLIVSGSSLFTLGFATVGQSVPKDLIVFTEAAIGLLLAALLIAYLPTIYAAWQRREREVATLEVRAGSPPACWNLIIRYLRIEGLESAQQLWPEWEVWFIDLEESHTSLAALSFFRSPQPNRSWVNAAGVILDSAAMFTSAVEVPRNPSRQLMLRAGYIALRRIADLYLIPYNPDPKPDDPISITRAEFDEVCAMMAAAGVPLKPDRDRAWRDFAGWRVNYDEVLLLLAAFTVAPYAPWISDRSPPWRHPLLGVLQRLRGRYFGG